MNEQILRILENNCDISHQQIAAMLAVPLEDVVREIEEMKEKGVILTTKTLINWEKTNVELVTAMIELRVTPQRGEGFERIAERIYQYPEVSCCYLMSGGYDIGVTIEGRTMKEVAMFVAQRLAPMDFVVSTATHFVLKKYKEYGVVFDDMSIDERSVITL